jgi:Flp pilus assembly pilin Flp
MTESDGQGSSLMGWVVEAKRALRCQEGQTLVEYALIIGFIGMATIAAMIVLGPAIGDAFQTVTGVIEGHMPL